MAATANKCLHGVPGASFVIARRSALALAATRTFYLDLKRLSTLQDQRGTPFTPSVQVYYALVEALRVSLVDGKATAATVAAVAGLVQELAAGVRSVRPARL